jgi:predicted signal transduction protein with EAL and GGDEF domain
MTGDMVLAQADAAMYFAKKAGKGHYRFYDVELDQATGSSVAGNAPFTANP